MPTISVIVPVYKVEKYIHRCVDSILGQTYADFELILVDDGSPDNCGAICDEYAARNSRVVVIHQKNGGLSAARNAAIDWTFANSDSQWLTFIDSDDWVHPEYLQRLLGAAVENNVAVSICGYKQTDGADPVIIPETLEPVLWDTEAFYVKQNVNATIACGKLYQKECFRNIRYPLGKLHEDEFTTYKILFAFQSVAVISAPLYAYYTNPESIIQSAWSPRRMDALDAYSERLIYFRQHKMATLYHWTLGVYIWYIVAMRDKVLSLPDADLSGKCGKILLRRLRRTIIIYKKDLPVSKFAGVYSLVFPDIMQLYWAVNSQCTKIKNLMHPVSKG